MFYEVPELEIIDVLDTHEHVNDDSKFTEIRLMSDGSVVAVVCSRVAY